MRDLPLDFQVVPGRSGWRRTAAADDRETLESQARALQKPDDPPAFQIVCGSLPEDANHEIYVIEDLTSVEVARAFAVGTHNADETEPVCDALAQIFEVLPFRPYFVDAAGYKASFSRQVTTDEAARIEAILIRGLQEIGFFGLEGYVSEYSGEGPLLTDTLVQENQIRLWWD